MHVPAAQACWPRHCRIETLLALASLDVGRKSLPTGNLSCFANGPERSIGHIQSPFYIRLRMGGGKEVVVVAE